MNGRDSKLTKKIETKYGKVELGKIYEIDGKKYKLTDGNLDDIFKQVDIIIDKVKNEKL